MKAKSPYLDHVIGCNHRDINEVRLSDCSHGCKVYKCKACEQEMVLHYEGYGCLRTDVEYL